MDLGLRDFSVHELIFQGRILEIICRKTWEMARAKSIKTNTIHQSTKIKKIDGEILAKRL